MSFERQFLLSKDINTYHKIERGEKSYDDLTNVDKIREEYLFHKSQENVGHSFETIYDDDLHDFREELYHRHIIPELREASQRRQQSYLRDQSCTKCQPPQPHQSKKYKSKKPPETFFPFIQY